MKFFCFFKLTLNRFFANLNEKIKDFNIEFLNNILILIKKPNINSLTRTYI